MAGHFHIGDPGRSTALVIESLQKHTQPPGGKKPHLPRTASFCSVCGHVCCVWCHCPPERAPLFSAKTGDLVWFNEIPAEVLGVRCLCRTYQLPALLLQPDLCLCLNEFSWTSSLGRGPSPGLGAVGQHRHQSCWGSVLVPPLPCASSAAVRY